MLTTPARQPHPQEYIITMGRIIKARNMLIVDGYHNADVLDRMVNLLRARPHTSLPAPAPDEKCEICGNPLEYHNNAYRWCKNMHSFRYFQSPHTTAPAPEEPEITDKMFVFAIDRVYEKGMKDGAKAGREQVLDELFEWIEKEKRGCDNPDMCLFTTKEMQEKVESLRGAQEEQGGVSE